MWPSLSAANQIANLANVALVLSLVVGVVATITIVWMGGVKERYWDKDRQESSERVASLVTQGDQLRKDTAEANARAAEAQLALEKFRAGRTLTPEQRAKITEEMRPFAGTPVVFGVFQDPEPIALLDQLSDALTLAGWSEQEWKSGGDIVMTRGAGHSIAGYTLVSGLYVQADNSHADDFGPIVAKLAKLLTDAGIPAKPEVGHMAPNTNNDAIKILIGQKPR